MIRAGVVTKSFRLPANYQENNISFFIYNKTKDRFFDLDIVNLSSDKRYPIPHPCAPDKVGFNAEAVWRSSVLLNKDGNLNETELVRAPDLSLKMALRKKGIWLGEKEYTDNVIKARRLIFEPAYIWQIGLILKENYQITQNHDIFEILSKMEQSKNEFAFYDAEAVRYQKAGRQPSYVTYWPVVHLWVRYIKTIYNSVNFVDKVFESVK
tara:strand:- start:32486 stop:33115 length:630 start_codon:yes stop_codon:yes gene_type:complete